MSTVSNRTLRTLRLLAVLAAIPATASLAAAQALPPASELIAKWAKATNADVWKEHKSQRMKAAFDIPSAGISANMEVVTIFPNQVASRVDIPGMGEMRQGYDGTTAWMNNPMQGPSLLSGPQLEAAKEDNNPANYSRVSPAITASETVEKTTLGGAECYKVKHTWKSGKTSFDCFSTADGMITWSQSTSATPMGEVRDHDHLLQLQGLGRRQARHHDQRRPDGAADHHHGAGVRVGQRRGEGDRTPRRDQGAGREEVGRHDP